jgi:hypothetical protein
MSHRNRSASSRRRPRGLAVAGFHDDARGRLDQRDYDCWVGGAVPSARYFLAARLAWRFSFSVFWAGFFSMLFFVFLSFVAIPDLSGGGETVSVMAVNVHRDLRL